MLPTLELGPLKIPMYGLCAFLGFAVGLVLYLLTLRHRKYHVSKIGLALLTSFTVLLSLGFAVLWDNISHAIEGQEFGTAGISFLGGAAAGIPLFYWFAYLSYKDKMAARTVVNAAIPPFFLAHAFGRVGCLFAGCCYGRPSSWWWGITYPEGSKAYEAYSGAPLIPTPIIEAVFLLICSAVFFFLVKKHRAIIYFFVYGTYRFFAEYLRGDDRGSTAIPVFSPGQFLSLFVILAAGGVLAYQLIKKEVWEEAPFGYGFPPIWDQPWQRKVKRVVKNIVFFWKPWKKKDDDPPPDSPENPI